MIRREFLDRHLYAFHTDPIGGEGRHPHTWQVRLYWAADPFIDGRDLGPQLDAVLHPWQGRDLPVWSSADLAATILRAFGRDVLGVEVSRADGPGADAFWE